MNDTISRLQNIGTNPPFFSDAFRSLNTSNKSTPSNQILQTDDRFDIVTKLTPKKVIEAFLASGKGGINLLEGFRNEMSKLQTSASIGLQVATDSGNGGTFQQGLYTNFGIGGFAAFLKKGSDGASTVFTEQAEAIKSAISIILENPLEAVESLGVDNFNVAGRGVVTKDQAAKELTNAIAANSDIIPALKQAQSSIEFFVQSQSSITAQGAEQEKLAKQITEKPPGSSSGSPGG